MLGKGTSFIEKEGGDLKWSCGRPWLGGACGRGCCYVCAPD